MTKSWFERWFDTEYYHLLYNHRNDEEAERFLSNLIEFLQIPVKSRIIDIGCGRGRHARYLSQLDFDVTGIDIASSSIDFAKQYESDNLHFKCFDKRKVFKKAHFDLALNLFTSYGFLKERSDLEVALISMVSNLKTKGRFVLDYMNAEKIKSQKLGSETEKLVYQDITFEFSKHIEGHQIIKDISVTDGDLHKSYREEVHLITLQEFRELFDTASLKILHTFGNYQLEAFDPQTSDRLILIAEKH